MKRLLATLLCVSLVACGATQEGGGSRAGGSSANKASRQRHHSQRLAGRHAAKAERHAERRAEDRADLRAERRTQARAERRAEARKRRRRAAPTVLVSRVVDGDTIEVQLNGATVDIRLIGIDTPETVDPGEPVGCYGPQASSFTAGSLEGEAVRLEYDVEREDQYGRTLAYAFLGERLFNESLVAQGYARVSTYPPNTKYVERFLTAQRRARRNGDGLWNACPAGGVTPSPTASATQETPAAGGGNCDANYSGACIPPYPPDLDCTDAPQGFKVVGDDPHGFDADSDGLACEA